MKNKKHLLFAILLVAGFFRFWQIGLSDVVTDEASLGFRALGWIDFDASAAQRTPWEKVETIPGWMKLSMHDHPPLFFIVQNLALTLFGHTTLALRIFSALFGLGSVILLYRIASKLFDQRVALIAALLAAADTYLIFSSRLGLQEATVLFFILAAILEFLAAEHHPRRYLNWGLYFGLALLTKYTALIIFPICAAIFIFRRYRGQPKLIMAGITLALAIFLPVIIYNFKLFQTFGHFDFQFSYLFGQNVSDWQFQPGKTEFTGLANKTAYFFINLKNGWLWPMSIAALISLAYAVYLTVKKNSNTRIVLIAITCFFILYLGIGPAQRFLVLIIPFLLLMIALTLAKLYSFKRPVGAAMIIAIAGLQLFVSANAFMPVALVPAWSSALARDFSYTGYNALDAWLGATTSEREPKLSFEFAYDFLNQAAQPKSKKSSAQQAGYLFVYDEDMNETATLWTIHRYGIYYRWPVLKSQQYFDTIGAQGQDAYFKMGFEKIFFIQKTDVALGKKFSAPEGRMDNLLSHLGLTQATSSQAIKNNAGETAFMIFTIP